MRILVLSKETWRDEQNGGNVLSNIFANIDAEFAQIYCTESEPNNSLCKLYYQMTDNMMVQNILRGKKVGRIKNYENYPSCKFSNIERYHTIKKLGIESVRVAREIIWSVAHWDVDSMIDFAKSFNPDVIFAPCYGSHYMIKLTKIMVNALHIPVISYISDDFYTNHQFRFSPFFWINHMILRRNIREVFQLYDLVYTMTEEQKMQCERDFKANMKILRKSGLFQKGKEKKVVGKPIKFVYAGGIYLNRWKTLSILADAMREINKSDTYMTLDIYTNSQVDEGVKKKLNDGKTAKMHSVISRDKLMEVYRQSDVALHVEGFDLKNKQIVRNSFSTKIVDCLDSGCAIMAICDSKQAGFAYLKRNEAAICVDDLRKLKGILINLLNDGEKLIKYQQKAFELGRKNHIKKDIDEMIEKDFKEIAGKTK